MATNETVGELVERLGEQEAMNFLVAQSIQLRSLLYDLLNAWDEAQEHVAIDAYVVMNAAIVRVRESLDTD